MLGRESGRDLVPSKEKLAVRGKIRASTCLPREWGTRGFVFPRGPLGCSVINARVVWELSAGRRPTRRNRSAATLATFRHLRSLLTIPDQPAGPRVSVDDRSAAAADDSCPRLKRSRVPF